MKLKIEVTEEDWRIADLAAQARTKVDRPPGIPPRLMWNSVSCSCPVAIAIWRKLGTMAEGFPPSVGNVKASFIFWGKPRKAEMTRDLQKIVSAFDHRNDIVGGYRPITGMFELEFT